MINEAFDRIAKALSDYDIPFIVVGGIAVIHHGYGRLTHDIDLVVKMDDDTIPRVYAALSSIGYTPAIPVTQDMLIDPETRKRLVDEKNMQVLNFVHPDYAENSVDLFIELPFDFAAELAICDTVKTDNDTIVKIVSCATLLDMKKRSGRLKDLADVDELNLINGKKSSYDETGSQ